MNAKAITLMYDATILAQGEVYQGFKRGIYWVAYNILLNFCTKRKKHLNLVLYCDDKLKDNLKEFLKKHSILNSINIWSKADSLYNIDAFYSPIYRIPEEVVLCGHIRKYTTIYDCAPIVRPLGADSWTQMDDPKTWFYKLYYTLNPFDKYFVISKSSITQFITYTNVNKNNLYLTYLGVSDKFKRVNDKNCIKSAQNKYHIPTDKKYFLFVGAVDDPKKNIPFALNCFIDFIKKDKIPNLMFVVGGNNPPDVMKKLFSQYPDWNNYLDKIVFTGFIDDEDISAIYSGAECFVFPSLFEGFGLPVLEAMKCGIPVISSNTTSMPEIVRDNGLLIDPKSKQDLIGAFRKILFLKNKMKVSQKAIKYASSYSWLNTADKMLKVIMNDQKNVVQEIPIVFHTDNNYVIPTVITITSLLVNKYKNTNYKIYILGNKLTQKNKNIFMNIKDVEVINHISQFNHFEGSHKHVSSTDLFKFDLPIVFPQYDKILYLDVDMIIQHDLSDLYNIDISEHYAAAVKDMHGMVGGKHHDRLHLINYFNAGMMLLNLRKMREDNIAEKLIDYKLHKDQGYFMSQDALNYVFAENVKYISPQYNYMASIFRYYPEEQIKSFYEMNDAAYQYMLSAAHIVHLTDKKKPWKYKSAWGADLWAKYYYMSPLKDKKIKYLDKQKDFRFIGSSERNGVWKFFVFGIPLFGTLKAVKKNGNLKIKKYFLGIPYFYKEKAAYKDIYHILGTEITVWKNLLCKKVEFSKQVNSSTDISGLSHAEKWGRWSCAETVTMMFKLPVDKGDLRFSFNLKPYLNEYHRQQKVSVFVNDSFVAEWTFEYKKAMPKTEFVLPQKMIKKSGKTFVEFRIEHPVSPKDLGLAADARKLGVGFVNMLVMPAIVKESKIKKLWRKIFPPKKQEIDYLPEFKALLKEVGSLKSGIDMMQKEIKTLKNEQITIQKMLVDEKVLLQKKRRLK